MPCHIDLFPFPHPNILKPIWLRLTQNTNIDGKCKYWGGDQSALVYLIELMSLYNATAYHCSWLKYNNLHWFANLFYSVKKTSWNHQSKSWSSAPSRSWVSYIHSLAKSWAFFSAKYTSINIEFYILDREIIKIMVECGDLKAEQIGITDNSLLSD